jgi:hypothetical protein
MTQTSGLKKEKKLMEFIAGHSYKVEIQENEYPIFDTNIMAISWGQPT